MLNLVRRYHAYLVARAENQTTIQRMFDRGVMTPWILPMAVGGGVCWLLHLGKVLGLIIFLPLALVSLIGMAYAGLVMLVWGICADVRRLRAAKAERK